MTKPAPWTFTPAGRRVLEFANAAWRLSLKRAKQAARAKLRAKWAAQRRKAAQKPRQRVRPRSAAEQARMDAYRPVRDAYLAEHPRCEVVWFGQPCCNPSVDNHHLRGRLGTLLCDTRFFLAVCRGCHDKIRMRTADAIKHGYLPPKGEWNTLPKNEPA